MQRPTIPPHVFAVARKLAKLEQEDLAREAGLSRRTISLLENGTRVAAETVDAVRAALKSRQVTITVRGRIVRVEWEIN